MSQVLYSVLTLYVSLQRLFGSTENDGSYISVGCYEDRPQMPISGAISFQQDVVRNCYKEAKIRNFEYFAVQDRYCYTSKDASDTYTRNGASTKCEDGRGGYLANDVYAIVVNGSWSAWSNWTECSSSCKGGTKMRYRICNDPSPTKHGLLCETKKSERSTYEVHEVRCNDHVNCPSPCKVRDHKDECCVFPFKYKNVTYNECTTIDEGDNKSWCASSTNFQPGQWGYCVNDTNEVCEVRGHTGECCVFPFTYKNVTYSGCTGRDSESPWCASTTHYREHRWGYCVNETAVCAVRHHKGACCTFPFKYHNVTYNGCTRKHSGLLWCASSKEDGEDWGYCVIDRKNGTWREWSGWTQCSSSCKGGLRMTNRACEKSPEENGNLQCVREKSWIISSYEIKEEICNGNISCPANAGRSSRIDQPDNVVGGVVGGVILLITITSLMIYVYRRGGRTGEMPGMSMNGDTQLDNIESLDEYEDGVISSQPAEDEYEDTTRLI